MSNSKKRLDENQTTIFEFNARIDEYLSLKQEILSAPKPAQKKSSWEEECIEVAASIKQAIKQSGMSREEVVDAINDYYGWSAQSAESKEQSGKDKSLSIHMLNHYLSKPAEYPIPAYLIFAIQNITKSISPSALFAEAEDAQVISGDEKRALTLGKLDETIQEMQKLKRELRGRK